MMIVDKFLICFDDKNLGMSSICSYLSLLTKGIIENKCHKEIHITHRPARSSKFSGAKLIFQDLNVHFFVALKFVIAYMSAFYFKLCALHKTKTSKLIVKVPFNYQNVMIIIINTKLMIIYAPSRKYEFLYCTRASGPSYNISRIFSEGVKIV